MTSGKKQFEEARRQALVSARALTQEEKHAIQLRREAAAEKRAAMAAQVASKPVRQKRRSAAGKASERRSSMGRSRDGAGITLAPGTPPDETTTSAPPAHAVRGSFTQRQRKSRRLTFSAIAAALDDIADSAVPEDLDSCRRSIPMVAVAEVASDALGAGVVAGPTAAASPLPQQGVPRGKKRLSVSMTNSPETILARTALMTASPLRRTASSPSSAANRSPATSPLLGRTLGSPLGPPPARAPMGKPAAR